MKQKTGRVAVEGRKIVKISKRRDRYAGVKGRVVENRSGGICVHHGAVRFREKARCSTFSAGWMFLPAGRCCITAGYFPAEG